MNEEDFVCLWPGSMPVVPIVAEGELWHPWLCNWGIPPLSDIPLRDGSQEMHANSPEDERNPVMQAEPSSPDTLAAPESPRSPYLYDIPPFRRSQSPSPLNLVEAAVDAPESEATVAVKPEPSSPETVQDVVERNTLGGRVNGHGIRRNLQFFINRGNQRRAISHAQMLRRRRMQEEQFGIRQYRRHVDELQRQQEQRLRDSENAPCNSIPVSRGRRFHGAPRFVERFSVRDEEESGCMSPYDLY
ncbi:uncharacterized protein FFB14_04925 [Fusarium fujikuroi]|nr:uncharacterized protein FFB14_04925 [Fusarium fujikuroi]